MRKAFTAMLTRGSNSMIAAACLGIVLIGTLAAAAMARAQDPSANQWRLVWADEFNGTHLNTSTWNAVNTNHPSFGLQRWTPRAVSVRSGALQITSSRVGGNSYTSGRIDTSGHFDFRYGRVDIRAKTPRTQGMWPALWMLPSPQGNTAHEIDIMELLGNNPHRVYMTYHWGEGMVNQTQCEADGPDFSAGYHVYSVEWAPTSVTWFIDGVRKCQATRNIYQGNMYLVIDSAVGGDWPGAPDRTTAFPQTFLVDYVRVYQK